MDNGHHLEVKDRRRRERKIWRTALLVSGLMHLVIFFGWRGTVIPQSPFSAAGPRAGDNRAAQGSLQAMNVRVPPRRTIVPPLVPIPALAEIEPVEFEPDAEVDASSVLGERPGTDEGPGLETGTGLGDGGTAEEGFYRLQPPSPRGMIIPPTNRELRGTTVQVWVFVNERGRVVADSTRLEPPTRDRDFNSQLIREAAEWVFRPAQKEGRAVPSWYPYTISM
jgi:hypothetical protein